MEITGNTFSSDVSAHHITLRSASGPGDTPSDDWFASASDFDNNVYCPDGEAMFNERINGGSYIDRTFAQWQSATGLDTNSTIKDAPCGKKQRVILIVAK